jgi:hypothetical protein
VQIGAEGRAIATSRALRCARTDGIGTRLATRVSVESGGRTMRHSRASLGIVAAALLAAAPVLATPITPAAFGAYQVMESFEGVATGPNVNIGLGASLLQPGIVSAFTFASGVVLTSPVPNPGVFNSGPFIHDFARGADVQNTWGATGTVNDASDVPFGMAYFGAFHPSGGIATFSLSFATPQDRVGAYVTGAGGSTITMRVYDGSGTLLDTITASAVVLSSWGGNFVGSQVGGRISRVTFSGTDFGIDGLTFEDNPLLVPEPSTLSTMLLGLLGLAGLASAGRGRREWIPARTRE